jgi:hypothetical protein
LRPRRRPSSSGCGTLETIIAHGRYVDIDSPEYDRLHHEVLWMMDVFRDQIDTNAQLGAFRR